MISLKINLSKIDKNKIFSGKDGAKYIDILLIPKQTQYGDYMAVQSISKADRDAGQKSPILGNGKNIGTTQQQQPPAQSGGSQGNWGASSEGDLPF